MASITLDQVVAKYLELRDQKGSILAEAKRRADVLDVQMSKLEAYIKEQADAQGVTSFRTTHGTAFLTTSDYANIGNWDETLKFIQEHGAYDLLEKRVSKNAVRAYIDLHKSVPPGVNYGTKLDVNVRKPSTKLED